MLAVDRAADSQAFAAGGRMGFAAGAANIPSAAYWAPGAACRIVVGHCAAAVAVRSLSANSRRSSLNHHSNCCYSTISALKRAWRIIHRLRPSHRFSWLIPCANFRPKTASECYHREFDTVNALFQQSILTVHTGRGNRMTIYIAYVVGCFVCGVIAAVIARKTGRSPAVWFLVGACLNILAVSAILIIQRQRLLTQGRDSSA